MTKLPDDVGRRLDEWKRALEEKLGDRLVGILLHGSAVRGEYRPGESDLDAIVVVKEVDFDDLNGIANAMQLARFSVRVEAMILTESEIAGASDCFPLLYDEIKQHHRVLVGRDPFAAIEVSDAHRRLRIEQELRDAMIRSRRVVTDGLGASSAIGGALGRKIKQVRPALHALLALKGVACASDLASVLSKSGETWGADVKALRNVREAPREAHVAFVELLGKAIAEVDAMEV